MTCIAYRDGLLAADTLITDEDGCKIGYARKIRKTEDGCLAGASGDCDYCAQFMEWVVTDRTTKTPKQGKGDSSILITPDRKIYYFYGRTSDILLQDYIAIGAGTPFAMAAFFNNADAIKAVETAIQFHGFCGGDIMTERLENVCKI